MALVDRLLVHRLPPSIKLNEPESSLHPDLMELASLVAQASERSQIGLATRSERPAAAATGMGKMSNIPKRAVAAWIEGLTRVGGFDDERSDANRPSDPSGLPPTPFFNRCMPGARPAYRRVERVLGEWLVRAEEVGQVETDQHRLDN